MGTSGWLLDSCRQGQGEDASPRAKRSRLPRVELTLARETHLSLTNQEYPSPPARCHFPSHHVT